MPSAVAIVPLYNHGRTVCSVLEGLHRCGLPILVVDDGSSDGGDQAAEGWLARHSAGRLVRHARNAGKAEALLTGLRQADADGHEVALTVDADGQHDLSLVPRFMAAASEMPAPLVVGHRTPLPAGYPLARLVGRLLSCLAVHAASGVAVGDAACGMRVYPVRRTLEVRCMGGRYAWEEEVIARLAWRGVRVTQVEIPVIYLVEGRSVSHYRFGRDWGEGTLVLVSCIVLRVLGCGGRAPDRARLRASLAWPAVRGGAPGLDSLQAIVAAGVAGVIVAAGTLLGGAFPGGVLAAVVCLWAALRTATSMPAAAMACALAIALPWAGLALAPLSAVALVLAVRARRGA